MGWAFGTADAVRTRVRIGNGTARVLLLLKPVHLLQKDLLLARHLAEQLTHRGGRRCRRWHGGGRWR